MVIQGIAWEDKKYLEVLMIKFSPSKTSAEQSLKVFSNILTFFTVPHSDSNVNNHISKMVCNGIYKRDCWGSYAWEDIGDILRFLQGAGFF